jgi:hypothetical protein
MYAHLKRVFPYLKERLSFVKYERNCTGSRKSTTAAEATAVPPDSRCVPSCVADTGRVRAVCAVAFVQLFGRALHCLGSIYPSLVTHTPIGNVQFVNMSVATNSSFLAASSHQSLHRYPPRERQVRGVGCYNECECQRERWCQCQCRLVGRWSEPASRYSTPSYRSEHQRVLSCKLVTRMDKGYKN